MRLGGGGGGGGGEEEGGGGHQAKAKTDFSAQDHFLKLQNRFSTSVHIQQEFAFAAKYFR